MRLSICGPVRTGLLVGLTLTFGCNDEAPRHVLPDEVCKSSCQECENLGQDAYACLAVDEARAPLAGFDCIVCAADDSGSAAATCAARADAQSIRYSTMDAQVVACESMTARCTGWNPNRHVHPTQTNEWDIERDFIDALVADPSQLVGCDDTRVQPGAGFYQVTAVDSDDLLGRLGFIDDDRIQSVNGYSMDGVFAVVRAFVSLWPDTRVFTVVVFRPGVGLVTLTYNLV